MSNRIKCINQDNLDHLLRHLNQYSAVAQWLVNPSLLFRFLFISFSWVAITKVQSQLVSSVCCGVLLRGMSTSLRILLLDVQA